MRSMSTPAREASYSASIIALSTMALHLMTIRAGAPARALAGFALDELDEPRAERHRRDEQPPERALPRQAGQDVEQVA